MKAVKTKIKKHVNLTNNIRKDTNIISNNANQNVENKYLSMKDLITNENNNYDGNIKVLNNIKGIENTNNLNNSELYHKAVDIFNKYHNKNEFINNEKVIIVSNSDIKESVNKTYTNKLQNKYIKEHLQVFSDLGDVIKSSKLVNQVQELKGRSSNNTWSYYINGLNIGNKKYFFEFDVVTKKDGKNHYRVQRLQKKTDDSAGSIANSKTAPTSESSVLDNNIPQTLSKVNRISPSQIAYVKQRKNK